MVSTDIGNINSVAHSYLRFEKPRSFFAPMSFGNCGYALPTIIGAKVARPDRPAVAYAGDGAWGMSMSEIMTAVNYRLPLNVVVFNNATMGLIRKNQHQQYHGRYIDCDFVNPDYRALACSFAIGYQKITSEEDLDALFRVFDLVDAINLIEIVIDKNAFPNYRSGR